MALRFEPKRDEHLALVPGQFLGDGAAQGGEHLDVFGVVGGVDPPTVGEAIPVIRLHDHGGALPKVPTEFARNLEDDEAVERRGEPALAAELGQLGGDGDQDVVCGLVLQLRAAQGMTCPPPADLGVRRSQQVLVDAREGVGAARVGGVEVVEPLTRVGVEIPPAGVERTFRSKPKPLNCGTTSLAWPDSPVSPSSSAACGNVPAG
jgi:hypothetical protein